MAGPSSERRIRSEVSLLPLMTQAGRSGRGWTGERQRLSPDLREALGATDMTAPAFHVAGPRTFVEDAIVEVHFGLKSSGAR